MAPVGMLMMVMFLGGLAEGAKILAVFPFPAPSHQAIFQPIIRELGNRGHQVTAYLPSKLSDPPPGYKEVLLPNLFQDLHETVNILDFAKLSALEQVITLHEIGLYVQQKLCAVESIQQLIHTEEKFDAVMLESLFVQEGLSALQHKFGAVSIEVMPLGDSAWINEVVGNSYNPSYVLDFKSPFTDKMTFYERLHNSLVSWGTNLIGYLIYMPKTQTFVDNCFKYKGWEDRPSVKDLMANKSLVLINNHFSLNYAYPMSPHVINIAGTHIGPNKPLPKDVQTFMDGAKDGVIYFSLGSNINVSSVAKENIFHAFKTAFEKIKLKVLWKWENEDLPGKPANVKISKWFPQQDILAHKNCKLFITHGGFLSITEAVYYGVPMVGIPFFGDQPKNMKQVTSRGYGLQLDYSNITEQSVSWAINEILSNPSYTQAAQERSKIFRDQPRPAVDNAVYWIQYVLRHRGAPHLRTALSSMKWYEALNLDVIGVLFLGAILFLLLICHMIKRSVTSCWNLCCRGKKKQPVAEKKAKKKTN